jgi:hypothetical protein
MYIKMVALCKCLRKILRKDIQINSYKLDYFEPRMWGTLTYIYSFWGYWQLFLSDEGMADR